MTEITRNPQARHHFRRLGLHRAACRARACQARLPHPRRHAPARPRRPSAAARQCRADPGRSRPISACAGRSTAPSRAPTTSSTWSASCIRSGRQNFSSVQDFGARAVAEAARAAKARLTHGSALGADLESWSIYARTKARGEKAVQETLKDAVIFRPVDRVRPGGRLLQPLRRHGAAFAGAAADRRRAHALPAGLSSATSPRRSPVRSTATSRAARSTSLAGRTC